MHVYYMHVTVFVLHACMHRAQCHCTELGSGPFNDGRHAAGVSSHNACCYGSIVPQIPLSSPPVCQCYLPLDLALDIHTLLL